MNKKIKNFFEKDNWGGIIRNNLISFFLVLVFIFTNYIFNILVSETLGEGIFLLFFICIFSILFSHYIFIVLKKKKEKIKDFYFFLLSDSIIIFIIIISFFEEIFTLILCLSVFVIISIISTVLLHIFKK